MSRAEDVNTLFRRFGGNAETYKEIVADQQVTSAVSKWPMLDQIRVQILPSAPSAQLADMAKQERIRQVIPVPVHPVPLVPVPVEPPVSSLQMDEPVVASEPAVTAEPAVVAEPTPVMISPVVELRPPEVLPPPVVEAPLPPKLPETVSAAEAIKQGSGGLKSVFQRMVPQRQVTTPAAPSHPLKRLAKW